VFEDVVATGCVVVVVVVVALILVCFEIIYLGRIK